jgi:D-aminopeptidase
MSMELATLRLARRAEALLAPFAGKPGASIGLVRDGRLLVHACGGLASIEAGTATGPETLYRIASVSKQFTCAAIMLLAQEGKLSPADPISRHLQGLPAWGDRVTLDHLMRNTSGVRDMLELMRGGGVDLSAIIPGGALDAGIARSAGLNFEPGSRFLYSNSAFRLLGLVVAKIAGMPLEEFLEARLFAPAGMTRTRHTPDVHDPVPGLATGYIPRPGGFRRAPHGFALGGEGGLVSGIQDLALWVAACEGGPFQGLEEQLVTPVPFTNGTANSYRRGLQVEMWRGISITSHGGLWPGFKTAFQRVPQQGIAVIVISNNGAADPGAMAQSMLEVALERVLHPAPAMPGLEGITGAWVAEDIVPGGRSFDLWVEKGRPMARQNGTAFALAPDEAGRLASSRGTIHFALEREGEAFTLHEEAGHSAPLIRVAEPVPLPEDAPGTYVCADLGASWVLTPDGRWCVEGPHARSGPFRTEGLAKDFARFHSPGALFDHWFDVRFLRSEVGLITGLLANGSRARGLRFARVD